MNKREGFVEKFTFYKKHENDSILIHESIVIALVEDRQINNRIEIKSEKWTEIFDKDNREGIGIITYKGTPDEVTEGDYVICTFSRDDKLVSVEKGVGSGSDITDIDFSQGNPFSEFLDSESEYTRSVKDYQVKIGNSTFIIPPLEIDVSTQSTINRVPALRANGSVKSQTGHSNVRVEMNLYFSSVDQINDPDNGLRALIAQFKRTPFLPVESKYLNDIHNVYAVTLANLTINTVPGFPNNLMAKLICYKFNHTPYVSTEPFFANLIDWPLFNWYYKKDLIYQYDEKGKPIPQAHGRLKAIPSSGMTNDFTFKYIPLKELTEFRDKTHTLSKTQAAKASIGVHSSYYMDDLVTMMQVKQAIEAIESNEELNKLKEDLVKAKGAWKEGLFTIENKYKKYLEMANSILGDVVGLPTRIKLLENTSIWPYTAKMKYESPSGFNWTPKTIDDGFGTEGYIFEIPIKGHLSATNLPGWTPLEREDEKYKPYINDDGVSLGYVRFIIKSADEIKIYSKDEDLTTTIQTSNPRLTQLLYNMHVNAFSDENAIDAQGDVLAANELIAEDYFATKLLEWDITHPDRLHPTNAMVAYENLVSDLQLQAMDAPTHQFLGSQDIFIKLDIRTDSEENVQDLKELFSYSQVVARDFADYVKAGFIKIDHDLANLMGVKYVLIDQINVRTVPNLPGVYDIEIIMIDFDVMQRRIERTGGIIGTADSTMRYLQIGSMDENSANEPLKELIRPQNHNESVEYMHQANDGRRSADELRRDIYIAHDGGKRSQYRYISINNMFKYFELYPDLELPTWEELSRVKLTLPSGEEQNATERIRWVQVEDDGTLRLATWNPKMSDDTPNGGIYVDPDFYFKPSIPISASLQRKLKTRDEVQMSFVDAAGNWEHLPYGGDYLGPVEIQVEGVEEPYVTVEDLDIDALYVNPGDNGKHFEITEGYEIPDGRALVDTIDKALRKHNPSYDTEEEIEKAIRLCTDKDKRLEVFPPLEEVVRYFQPKGYISQEEIRKRITEIIYSEIGAVATQPIFADPPEKVHGYTTKSGLSLNVNIARALFDYESNTTQLYPMDGIKVINHVEKSVIGQPVQAYTRWDDQWHRSFGIGQINLGAHWTKGAKDTSHIRRKDGKGYEPIDPWRIVYDHQYNIRYSLQYLKKKRDFLYNNHYNEVVDLLNYLIKHAGYPLLRSLPPVRQNPSSNKQFDDYRKTLHDFFWRLAAVAYEGFKMSDIVKSFKSGKGDPIKRYDALFSASSGRIVKYQAEQELREQSTNITAKYGPIKHLEQEEYKRSFEYQVLQPIDDDDHFYDIRAVFGPRPPTEEESLEGSWHDYINTDCSGRMVKAFPTYHICLIDEGRKIRWWKLWDNFYDMSAVVDLSIHKSRKNAADTCMITMSNVYGGVGNLHSRGSQSHIPMIKKSFWEVVLHTKPSDLHLELRDKLEPRLMLSAGSRISVRLGYGSNAAKMPVMFNGTITEFEPGDMVEIIAQGDGIELTNILPFSKKSSVNGFLKFGAEPRDLLLGLMTTHSAIQKAIRGITRGYFGRQEDSSGVIHFGSVDHTKGVWYLAEEIGENIYPANFKGEPYQYDHLINPFAWHSKGDEQNITIDVYNKTIWDVAQTCAMAMPNYIATVLPVGFRSTLFYGMAHWGYVYDWEIEDLGFDIEPGIRKIRKPLQQWHIYSSVSDIIDNSIKATSRDMYTNVIGTYQAGTSNILGTISALWGAETSGNHEASITAYADKDIYPQFQRTTQIYTGISSEATDVLTKAVNWVPIVGLSRTRISEALAFAVAQSAVRDYLKDMYQGELIVLGDPSVKPYDAVYLWDKYTEMFGIFEVKEVTHHLSLETGFITSIVPDCTVSVADPNRNKLWGWQSSLAAAVIVEIIFLFFKTSTAKIMSKGLEEAGTSATAKLTGWQEKLAATEAAGALGKLAGWGSALTGLGISLASLLGTASAGLLAAPPVASFVLGTVVLAITIQSVQNLLQRWLDQEECVVINFLTYRGREFSAGVLGHKGIVLGTQAGVTKYAWLNKSLEWLSGIMNSDRLLFSLGDELGLSGDGVKLADRTVEMANSWYGDNIVEANKMIEGYQESLHRDWSEQDERIVARTSGGTTEYMAELDEQELESKRNIMVPFKNQRRIRFHGPAEQTVSPAFQDPWDEFFNTTPENIIFIQSTWEPRPNQKPSHANGLAIEIGAIGKGIEFDQALDAITQEIDYEDIKNMTLKELNELANSKADSFPISYEFFNKMAQWGNWSELYGPWGAYQFDRDTQTFRNMEDILNEKYTNGTPAYIMYEAKIASIRRKYMDKIYVSRYPRKGEFDDVQ